MSLYLSGAGVDSWNGWIWPVPVWQGRDPLISDGFKRNKTDGHRQHLGADVMFRRLSSEPVGLPGASKGFAMPAGVPVLATSEGKITGLGVTSRGHFVKIDHGSYSTFYQHLATLNPRLAKGDTVKTGTYLGEVGGDLPPHYTLRHLHFELSKNGAGPREKSVVDPAPIMARWNKAVIDGLVPRLTGPKVKGGAGRSDRVALGGVMAGAAGAAGLVLLNRNKR